MWSRKRVQNDPRPWLPSRRWRLLRKVIGPRPDYSYPESAYADDGPDDPDIQRHRPNI